MNKKASITSFALLAGVAIASVAYALKDDNWTAPVAYAGVAHSCASVHFGMDDGTLQGTLEWGNSGSIAVGTYTESLGIVSGITMSQYVISGQAMAMIDGHSLKFSSSKKNSTITFTFGSKVKACDIYAVAWGADTASVSANGEDAQSVAKNASISGTSGSITATYSKYHFDFDESYTLEIAATKRIFVGDIALRLA